MKNIVLMLCIIFAGMQLQAQNLSKQQIKSKIDSKQFVFVAESMTPSRGGMKVLTPGYSLKISNDTLVSYLPYFGQAYNAPINSSDAGIDFTSINFSYSITSGKSKSYNIGLRTKDKTYNTNFVLTVYDNGSAYLQANNSDKQLISYKGYIK